MKPIDQERVENLFHAALELAPADRVAYISKACGNDQSLYQEVESLVAAFENGNGFIEQPFLELGMKVLSSTSNGTLAGKQVGSYKILSPLGHGGMGEVYLAEDTRLARKVALKFLSPEFVGDKTAKRQLIKEAQAVAMLDHPNICTVFGLEEVGEHSFIVMQYVEGETLASLIGARSLHLNEVLMLADQIISALAEAHARGIIHRDIKPKNIMVTPQRQIKVLDFGLAKTIRPRPSVAEGADSISQVSQVDVIPGTVAYMSPEQLRAEKLDYRSDIFSLGTVLYEMVSSKNPFARETTADVISSILTSKPPALKDASSQTSREIERMVRKCLEKDRTQRYQSASELLIEWENYIRAISVQRSSAWQFVVRWATTAVVVLLLVAVLAYVYLNWAKPRTMAILPIANETGDANLDFLAEGLTRDTIKELSGLNKLRVMAYTMVSGYQGQIDPQKIGQELKVDEVVIARIKGARDSLSLEAVMIDIEDGSQRWAKKYALDLTTSAPVSTELSKDLRASLGVWSQAETQIQTHHSANPEARNEYMRGLHSWRKRDNNYTLKAAIDHFNTAIELDPTYAEAYAGLADCYALGNVVSYPDLGIDTKEAMLRAARAAKDALKIDDTLAEAHTSLGFVYMKSDRNWHAAEKEFKRAIELEPDYALAYLGYSNLRSLTGPQSDAIALALKAREFDPFSPVMALNFCRSYYYARRDAEASKCFDKLVEDIPGYTNGWYGRAFIQLQQGSPQGAIRVLEDLYAKDQRSAASALGYAYGRAGNYDAARRVLAEMENLSKKSYIPPYEFALIYLGLKDNENTVFWLRKAAEEKFATTLYIAVDPIYDPIRSDPRFSELVGSFNIPLQPNH